MGLNISDNFGSTFYCGSSWYSLHFYSVGPRQRHWWSCQIQSISILPSLTQLSVGYVKQHIYKCLVLIYILTNQVIFGKHSMILLLLRNLLFFFFFPRNHYLQHGRTPHTVTFICRLQCNAMWQREQWDLHSHPWKDRGGRKETNWWRVASPALLVLGATELDTMPYSPSGNMIPSGNPKII